MAGGFGGPAVPSPTGPNRAARLTARGRGVIAVDVAQPAPFRAVCLALAGGRQKRECRCQSDPLDVHLRNAPFMPPAIRAVASARMRAGARPPGLARKRGSHTGANFSL